MFNSVYIFLQLLQEGQAYNIVLKLELPETPQNLNLGMFMANMTVKGQSEITPNTGEYRWTKRRLNPLFDEPIVKTSSKPVRIVTVFLLVCFFCCWIFYLNLLFCAKLYWLKKLSNISTLYSFFIYRLTLKHLKVLLNDSIIFLCLNLIVPRFKRKICFENQ